MLFFLRKSFYSDKNGFLFGRLVFFFSLSGFCPFLTGFVELYKHIEMEKGLNCQYEAPVVEIIEVEVERGFAASDLPDFTNVPLS